jgi:RNA polymerase sigma-70 factor (ECF subfamily)
MAENLADREFFGRAVTSLLDNLYAVALRLTRNRADAEDLVSEAVAKAWVHFDTLEDRQCFKAWILRILTNAFLSERRKDRLVLIDGDQSEPGEEEGFSLFERLHQPFLLWWGDPEREFLNKLLREDLMRALDGLPERYRMVVVLSDLEGCTYHEIAQALEVPVGTVRSRLSRARSLLQKALWEHADAAGLSAAVGAREQIERIHNPNKEP